MILIFGTTGQVARELAAQAGGRVFTALGRVDADLSDPAKCAAQIREHRPQAVINAAAYTAVDRAEQEEMLAHTVNAAGPGAMAMACAAFQIPFLHISTDYVFDGSGMHARKPGDPTAPQNAYGRTKLAGEKAIRASSAHHVILRTSWVFSEHGANFVKTMLRLSETRDMLSIVDDQIGGPSPARGIASALWTMCDAVLAGHNGGTYHYAGSPFTSWAEFARVVFDKAGRQIDVRGISTSDYPTPANRPHNSRLDCADLERDFGITQPDWHDDLARVIEVLA